MRKIICVWVMMVLIFTGCAAPSPAPNTLPTETTAQGIYEFTLSAEPLSGPATDEWEFTYIYNGEQIASGHQILFSLGLFAFQSIRVEVTQKGSPGHTYSATFPVAICSGGSGKTDITVTGADGKEITFKITCQVTLVEKQ